MAVTVVPDAAMMVPSSLGIGVAEPLRREDDLADGAAVADGPVRVGRAL
jgi:hypothetical protein